MKRNCFDFPACLCRISCQLDDSAVAAATSSSSSVAQPPQLEMLLLSFSAPSCGFLSFPPQQGSTFANPQAFLKTGHFFAAASPSIRRVLVNPGLFLLKPRGASSPPRLPPISLSSIRSHRAHYQEEASCTSSSCFHASHIRIRRPHGCIGQSPTLNHCSFYSRTTRAWWYGMLMRQKVDAQILSSLFSPFPLFSPYILATSTPEKTTCRASFSHPPLPLSPSSSARKFAKTLEGGGGKVFPLLLSSSSSPLFLPLFSATLLPLLLSILGIRQPSPEVSSLCAKNPPLSLSLIGFLFTFHKRSVAWLGVCKRGFVSERGSPHGSSS